MLKDFLNNNSMQNQVLKQIYSYIYHHGQASRAEIIEKMNLNRGKVTRSLSELFNKNYIQISELGKSEGGRPPSIYQITPTSSYLIGVQISRMYTKIALFNLHFNKIEQETIIMTERHTPEVVINDITQTAKDFMAKYEISLDYLLGIGIGAIGPLDRKNGIILNPEQFLAPGWEYISIIDKIKEFFPVSTILENGANVGALGEYKYNKHFKNILNVTSGWAWGCGVIMEEAIMHVESGDISRYGHMTVDLDGKRCYCGKKGCAVAYTSLHSILDQIQRKAPDFYHKYLGKFNVLPINQLMDVLLKYGDDQVESIIMDSAKYLGAGVANLAIAFHSELIVLNGPLLNNYPGYYEEVAYHTAMYLDTNSNAKISKGTDEGESGLIGAAYSVFDSLVDKGAD